MKRSFLKKASKLPISRLQKKIWLLCKEITRKRHGNSCYTCGQMGLSGSNQHTGHLWAKASLGAYLKYDLRVLKIQCYNCNINLGGMGADFYKRMLKEEGQEYMIRLEMDRRKTVKAYDHYIKVFAEYEEIIKTINK